MSVRKGGREYEVTQKPRPEPPPNQAAECPTCGRLVAVLARRLLVLEDVAKAATNFVRRDYAEDWETLRAALARLEGKDA